MSDALSTSEIEDVLSSIRRLVSDDLRPAPNPAPHPSSGLRAGGEADKLLLTPALRVVQAEDPGQGATRAIDDVLAAVSAGVDQQADDWESETGDDAEAAAKSPDLVEAEAGMWQDAPPVDAYAEPVMFVATPRPVTEEAADEVVTGPSPAPDATFDADADADTDTNTGLAEPRAPAARITLTAEDSALPGWAQASGPDEAEADEAPRDPAKGWAAQGWAAQGTVEPDRAWADEAEAAVLEELTAATQAAGMPPGFGPDEIILNAEEAAELPVDEAMLREIVRDVLREELQGRLGERITRNIRKLVRAEIARVMAAEDLL